MKNSNQHHWTKEDYILLFYICKFGTSGIWLKTVDDLLKWYKDTTVGSITKHRLNFLFLMGKRGLRDVKNLQQEVFNEYNTMSYGDFQREVHNIINEDDKNRERSVMRMGRLYTYSGRREVGVI